LLEDLDQITGQVMAVKAEPRKWPALLYSLGGYELIELEAGLAKLAEERADVLGAGNLRRLRVYSHRARQHLDFAVREIEVLLPWIPALSRIPPDLLIQDGIDPSTTWEILENLLTSNPSLAEVPDTISKARGLIAELQENLGAASPETRAWLSELDNCLDSAAYSVKTLLIGFSDLARQAEDTVNAMDFRFLFDEHRKVFHIGYNLALGKLDDNYYDLIASEARIASLIAISKGDVPLSHWLHLNRPFTTVDGKQVLLSWSATMFEYLMPLLMVREYEGTLLDRTSEAVTEIQIGYGREKGVPWGISESGFYTFDANQNYQYRAFGVPGLGLKRGLGDDLVITPYASLLALPIRPQQVLQNLQALKRFHMIGTYGLYEAVDFTVPRLPLGKEYMIVSSFMAHHQGMIFLSLANYFFDDRMVKRFHANPRVQAVELLLQEQFPQDAPLLETHTEDVRSVLPAQPQAASEPWRVRVRTPQPRVHLLSNGRYGVLITGTGAGYSVWNETDMTRWRADTSLNPWGTWIYIQDQDSQHTWSVGFQPTVAAPKSWDVNFYPHMAEYLRRDGDISLTMEITVPPDDDLEIRRITLTNHADTDKRLRAVSYGEVVMASQNDDTRHPAFNKLFIESEWVPAQNALIFRRRPRKESEDPFFMAHAIILEEGEVFQGSYEGDRMRFIGRGKTLRSPAALSNSEPLSCTTGATLDPIFSISHEVHLEAHTSIQFAFLTMGASSRQEAIEMIRRYRSSHAIQNAFQEARSHAEVEMLRTGLSSPLLENAERLLSLMLYPNAFLRAKPEILAANRSGQPSLWAYGISGDYPILLVKINDQEDLPLIQDVLLAHTYWRSRGLKIDVVFLNEQGMNYGQELNNQIHRLINRTNSDAWLNRRGGLFILPADRLGEADLVLLETVSRAILSGDRGRLQDHLVGMNNLPSRLPLFSPTDPGAEGFEPTPPLEKPHGLRFDNGIGGFSAEGREYVIYLENGRHSPAPWINVIANPEFGFLVTEMGSSYTWAVNSGENRLTPWSNDPVSDPTGEALYLRDEETGKIWSPTPLPAHEPSPYLVRHGAGYTVFEHNSSGLKQQLQLSVATDEPVKLIQLHIENTWSRVRRITATYYAEWVLGITREASQAYIIPEYDDESQALLARNPYNVEFAERTAFLAASKQLHGLTTDRMEFLGRLGSHATPAGLERVGLSGTVQTGLDPCAALQVHLDLQPGEVQELTFILGQGENREDALNLVRKYRDASQVEAAWQSSRRLWDDVLGAVQVKTPDQALDMVLNQWLLYQALSCRIWGRSAFYQSSGAYGFRDQLQDVMSILYSRPDIARAHILRAASQQFEAGDVLHWWHPPTGRGVRTRFSDDLLWLPYVVAYYVEATGDVSILDEQAPFRKGLPLEPEEDERYGYYDTTRDSHTILEHCRRALDKGTTFGPHDLPLMGAGDWNDGMNRVGIEGRGESVWLGWFLYATQMQFARVCERIGEKALASLYRDQAHRIQAAIEAAAWDGNWYLRAFYDDGAPLGSAKNRECKIDAIAQSWGVISGAADQDRARQAMQSVARELILPDDKLLLLLTPPFNKTPRDPGYIKGYLPGIRENGGQYTHAAIWTVWAFALLGEGDAAYNLFNMLNPITHSRSLGEALKYKVEPYVIAADVYSVQPHVGRGGWTWYTGSSGWMYRLGLEAILGLRLDGDGFYLEPSIPKNWEGYQIRYRRGKTIYNIEVKNPRGVSHGIEQVSLDGKELPEGKIPYQEDGGEHRVIVVMGSPNN
jgi:cyclic beta-1,2-glucan synthetase